MNSKFVKGAILAFLVINIAGWFFVARSKATPAEVTEPSDVATQEEEVDASAPVKPLPPPPFDLSSCKQVNFEPGGSAVLELAFNGEPDTNSVLPRLSFTGNGSSVPFSLIAVKGEKMSVRIDRPARTALLSVRLKKGASGTGKAPPLADDRLLGCPLSPLFTLRSVSARPFASGRMALSIEFNKFVGVENAVDFITFDPPVQASFSLDYVSGRWGDDFYGYYALLATGDFKASTEYKVTVAEGMKAKDNSVMTASQTKSVKTPDFRPSISVESLGRYLAPTGNLLVPVETVNVTNVTLRAERLLPQNIDQFAVREGQDMRRWHGYRDWGNSELLTVPVGSEDFPIRAGKNEKKMSALSLGKSVGKAERGIYLVSVDGIGDNGGYVDDVDSRIVCISDIGISMFGCGDSARGKMALWITSLSTGKALEGVAVSLYSDANELLAKGISDANGLLTLSVPDNKVLAVVVAEDPQAGDMTFLTIDRHNRVNVPPAPGGDNSRPYLGEGEYEAFVFADREIFRPGERAFFQVLVRDHNAVAPKSFPLELSVSKPDGKLYKTFSVMPDELGSVCQEIEFPEYLPMGSYLIEVSLPGESGPVIGSKRITVESFVPPQIRASVATDVKSARRGDKVSATISAEHLYGAPAEGLKAEARVTVHASEFAPGGWEGYAFGDDGIPLNVYSLAGKTTLLDKEGKGVVEFEIPRNITAPSRAKAQISCNVFENGGRTVSAVADVVIDTAPFYLGISRAIPASIKLDEEIRVPWVAVNADGTAFAHATNITAKLVKIDSHWSFVANVNGSTSWCCEKTETVVMKGARVPSAGADGKGEFRFTVSDYGDYRLVLSDNDVGTSASFAFWASWWANGESPSAIDSFSKLKVTTDKKEYAPGDRAVITVDAPFTGDLRIALKKDEVLKSYVIPMTNKTVDIVLPVSEKCAPNLEVLATLVRETKPEAVWAPHRAVGLASVKVLPPERALAVAVEVPETISPASVVDVTVRVSGKESGDARVTLLAVDEGICGLTAMKTPDPLGFFFGERHALIGYYDVYTRLMKVTDEKLTGFVSHIGGDGEEAFSIPSRLSPVSARRFKPVSLKTYNVKLTDGVAVIPVAVPEFTGRLRFMAIAWTASASGSAKALANVHRDVVVQADLPRMLAPGDKSFLSLAVDNTAATPAEVAFDIRCEGPVAVTELPGKLNLPGKTRKNLAVPVVATEGVGVGKVRITVSGSGTDYVDEIEIPVRPASAWRTHAESVVIPAGGTAVFEPEGDVIAATAGQRFELLPTPAADIRSAFQYLRDYPYGCLEQTTSAAFPHLIVAKLPEGYFDEAELADASVAVNAAIARLFTMTRQYGGFTMWPESRSIARFETLYALQFIAEAKRCGYCKDFISSYGNWIEAAFRWYGEDQASYRDKCYAVMDRALFGTPDKPFMARLLENYPTASGEARAMLARAYLLCGEPGVATEILTDLPVAKDLRMASFLLVSLSALNPADPRCLDCIRVINESLDKRFGHWGTTQDNAIAINALASYLAVAGDAKGGKSVSATLRVSDGEKEDSIVFPVGKKAKWASAEGQGMSNCEITNTGDGLLYVRRELHAVPQASALPPVTNGLVVTREYFTRDGVAVDPATVKRGDAVVVKVTVTTPDDRDDLVVEDLLPACLEIEKENMLLSEKLPWFAPTAKNDWVIHYEARDDRLLLFGKADSGQSVVWYYQARAVSAGEYALPAIQASAMYTPDVVARGAASKMTVAE